MNALESFERKLQQDLGAVVIGMEPVIRALAIAVVARGHVLLQGAPGLGKTLLSKSLAGALGGVFKRVQGTADLMPSDITGVHVFDAERRDFVFRPGPVFADVLLVDEINRTGPKTQSALLEAMEERQVTIDRRTIACPTNSWSSPPRIRANSKAPIRCRNRSSTASCCASTSRIRRGSTSWRSSQSTATSTRMRPSTSRRPRGAALAAAQAAVESVHVAPEFSAYVVDLAAASREHAHVSLGLSTRGVLALLRAARIDAGMRGAEFVTPDDVKAVAPLVIPHRLVLAPEAVLEGLAARTITQQLLDQTPVPR